MLIPDFFHFVSKNEVTGYILWALFFRIILVSSTGKNQLQNLRYQSEYQILSAECIELIPHILNNFQRDLVKTISSYVAMLHSSPSGPSGRSQGQSAEACLECSGQTAEPAGTGGRGRPHWWQAASDFTEGAFKGAGAIRWGWNLLLGEFQVWNKIRVGGMTESHSGWKGHPIRQPLQFSL